MRVFIFIGIPKEVQNEISGIQNQLPDFFGKKTKLENLHLTLKFLGEADKKKVDIIKEKLKEIKFRSFNLSIDSLGVFSEEFIRIVWVGLSGAENLQQIIDEKMSELGFEKEKRFMGHLTIARVKNIKNKYSFLENLKSIKFKKINFQVKGFYFMESKLEDNLRYNILETYSLE
jgi:RNA 2',3'-cyclic 3'-phosphodiesterase